MKNTGDKGSSEHGQFFPSTQWNILGTLRTCTVDTRNEHLNFLIERYWKPLYYYVRGRGYSNEEAQDIVQEFFSACLMRELFGQADPKRGRFRTFLLSCLENFLKNLHRAVHAQRRRPAGGIISLEDLVSKEDMAFEPPDKENPEAIFHRTWAVELVLHVLKQLENECNSTGKQKHYEIFRQRIIGPVLEGSEPPALAELSSRMGLTEKQAANFLLTARRAYQRLLRDEIGRFAGSEEEVAEEIQHVFRVLSGTKAVS